MGFSNRSWLAVQMVIDGLDVPWGLSYQFGVLARWFSSGERPFRVITRRYSSEFFPGLEDVVVQTNRPRREIDPGRPTLTGSYPASSWVHRAGVKRYTVLLPHVPWGLYPSRQQTWIGPLSVYVRGNGRLILDSLRYLALYPWKKIERVWSRRTDRAALRGADSVQVYDERLLDPVEDLYGRRPDLLAPVAPVGRGGSTEPENRIVVQGPFDPAQNLKTIVDAFYLFVNRLGTVKNEDWDRAHPLRMWSPGDFVLRFHGAGDGEEYLRNYAASQGLGEQVEFLPWIHPRERDQTLQSALMVVDLPLTGDASVLPYHAMALGVPALYSRRHGGLDSLVESGPLAHPLGCNDTDALARAMLAATRIPKSGRTPVSELRTALDPETAARRLVESVFS